MIDSRIILLGLVVILLSWASASASTSHYTYPGNFPIVYFSDFTYIPTDYGYRLSYKTQAGVSHVELGIVPGDPTATLRNSDNLSSDTLGSSKKSQGRKGKNFPLKNRKVSDKLLKSLTG